MVQRERSKPTVLEEKRIHLLKLSETLCDYIHVRQVRFRSLVEESDDRGGECST